MNRRIFPAFALALSAVVAAVVTAQSARSAPGRGSPPAEAHPPVAEGWAAERTLFHHLMTALSVGGIGLARKGTSVELRLENWKRGLEIDTIAPVARRGLALILREDSSARRATTLSARFSDYDPKVVTLTWSAKDFASHPERFRVTRQR
jgi:hypothetical protein